MSSPAVSAVAMSRRIRYGRCVQCWPSGSRWSCSFPSRSASVTTPATRPCGVTTGTTPIRPLTKMSATSLRGMAGVTVVGSAVMTSRTR